MDGLFEIYIPKRYINTSIIKFTRPQYRWGEIEYPQENPIFFYNEELKLVLIERVDYINKFLPAEHQRDDWARIEVIGEEVDRYFSSFFIDEDDDSEFAFKQLLLSFLKDIEHYTLAWLAEGDTVEKIFQVKDIEEVFQLFSNNPEIIVNGVITYK